MPSNACRCTRRDRGLANPAMYATAGFTVRSRSPLVWSCEGLSIAQLCIAKIGYANVSLQNLYQNSLTDRTLTRYLRPMRPRWLVPAAIFLLVAIGTLTPH